MPSAESTKRRQILTGLMKLLIFIGFVFVSIPFISSFSTGSIEEKRDAKSHWISRVSLTDLNVGEVKALPWAGGLIWVYTRTKKDIQLLKNMNASLRDEFSEKSDQPEHMKNNFRSQSKKFFVFIPQENKRRCQVRLNNSGEKFLFTEPCFGAKYDAAGRIFKLSGHKEQKNLAVPKHIIEDGILKVGIWMPKV